MDSFKKFSIRVSESTCGLVEEFAKSNKLSRNAAVELLLKLGIQSLQNSGVENERFDRLEKIIKDSFRLSYSNILFCVEMVKPTENSAAIDTVKMCRKEATSKADAIFGEDK